MLKATIDQLPQIIANANASIQKNQMPYKYSGICPRCKHRTETQRVGEHACKWGGCNGVLISLENAIGEAPFWCYPGHFDPCGNVTKSGDGFVHVRYLNGRWSADLVGQRSIVKQLRKEAGMDRREFPENKEATYEALLRAAGEHGLGLETRED